jgi:hypothetical protein
MGLDEIIVKEYLAIIQNELSVQEEQRLIVAFSAVTFL